MKEKKKGEEKEGRDDGAEAKAEKEQKLGGERNSRCRFGGGGRRRRRV